MGTAGIGLVTHDGERGGSKRAPIEKLYARTVVPPWRERQFPPSFTCGRAWRYSELLQRLRCTEGFTHGDVQVGVVFYRLASGQIQELRCMSKS